MTTAAAAVAPCRPDDGVGAGLTCVEPDDVARLSGVTATTSSNAVALHDVSLAVPRGRVTAVVSPRDGAAGVVVDVLAGRSRPRWGDVERPGSLVEARRMLGRPRGRSVRADLLAQRQVGDDQTDVDWVDQVATALRLRDAEGHRSWQDAEAQRVRWGFARSLVAQPDLLVADDLSGGYLRAAGDGLLEQLGVLVRDSRTAVLVATADLTVADVVDRVVVLDRGHMVEVSA
jgi:putative ABC transport system ATP-binding protein